MSRSAAAVLIHTHVKHLRSEFLVNFYVRLRYITRALTDYCVLFYLKVIKFTG